MHQQATDCMLLVTAFLQLAADRYLREADLLRRRALEGEFSGVLQDKDRAIGGLDTQRGGHEMALHDLVFTDIAISEEAVGRLGVRPILKGRGQRLARPFPERLK